MINTHSKENFYESYLEIEEKRQNLLKDSIDSQEKNNLFTSGIAIKKGVFSQDDLKDLINFQNLMEENLKFNCSGYINFQLKEKNLYDVGFNAIHPNYGQVRVQTKGMPFEMPGFKKLANHPLLREMYSWWHKDSGEITRGTLEWIIPSSINHNGWHKDSVRPQLKAFVLLSDVDCDTAPMYYAKGSHFIKNEFEKDVAFRMIKTGTNTIATNLLRKGNHYVAFAGGHSGYLGDDEAKNDPDQIDENPIVLGGFEYEKFVCTGNVGDVIFFDACGFHSGNKSNGKIRRTISLSSPFNKTDFAIALDQQELKTV